MRAVDPSDPDFEVPEPFTWPEDEALDTTVQGLALNQLSRDIHLLYIEKGFYAQLSPKDNMVLGTKVAMIHTEVSELLEAYRTEPTAPCDKIPDLTNEEEEFADIIIRTLDLAAFRNIDIGNAVLRKLEFGRTRAHKHGKNF